MAEKKKELNIEEAFARLEEINKLLENPDTNLKRFHDVICRGRGACECL